MLTFFGFRPVAKDENHQVSLPLYYLATSTLFAACRSVYRAGIVDLFHQPPCGLEAEALLAGRQVGLYGQVSRDAAGQLIVG